MTLLTRRSLLILSAGLAAAAAVRAEWLPNKRIEIIVPFAPGGVVDVLARVLTEPMSRELGQPVIVKNVVGAGGNIAYGQLARAKADGYTVGLIGSGLNLNSLLRPGSGFDTPNILRPLGYLGSQAFALLVNTARFDVRTVREAIDRIRKEPGKLAYASGGIGASSHVLMEYLKSTQDLKVLHVPYNGQAPAITATLAGDVDMTLQPVTGSEDLIRAGKLRPLACTGTARMKLFPNVPTFSEASIHGMEASGWLGLAAPASVPEPLARRLIDAWARSVARPEVQQALDAKSVDTLTMNDREFARMVADDRQRWKRVIEIAKVSVE
ncbi:tripartite tricarboxylate transporter substrate binding protein [Cupriavidus necator]|uniref:tripartite tricarboxylate transporter substrate binding protein n=1 Tax=Cupriavidus necator TaxID=106590 RepID=UPI0005B4BDDB|nr:tripartite tricarboxylate transporter substrate binding protein [Cupriavidus necator]